MRVSLTVITVFLAACNRTALEEKEDSGPILYTPPASDAATVTEPDPQEPDTVDDAGRVSVTDAQTEGRDAAPASGDAAAQAPPDVGNSSTCVPPDQPWKPAEQCGLPVVNHCLEVECPESSVGPIVATKIATVGDRLTALEQPPEETEDLYIADKEGRILILRDGEVLDQPFLDVGDLLPSDLHSEQGLLGMEFDPKYPDNGVLWISYTGRSGENVIASVERDSDNPHLADRSTLTTLFTQEQPRPVHNAGDMHFGRDGCLYVSIGDGGTMTRAGQDKLMLGKILRIDTQNYPEPAPGNLTGDEDTNPHIWSLGLRNPWRFSFDRLTADLYISDVGDVDYEEITVEPAGVGHFNHGWKFWEGPLCMERDEDPDCTLKDYRMPVAFFAHEIDGVKHKVAIGGYVYRGSKIPSLYGRYLYGDYETRRIWSFVYRGDNADGHPVSCSEVELTDQLQVGRKLTSFGEDNAGELYILAFGGEIYRIDPAE